MQIAAAAAVAEGWWGRY